MCHPEPRGHQRNYAAVDGHELFGGRALLSMGYRRAHGIWPEFVAMPPWGSDRAGESGRGLRHDQGPSPAVVLRSCLLWLFVFLPG